jgi:hypothetical protein
LECGSHFRIATGALGPLMHYLEVGGATASLSGPTVPPLPSAPNAPGSSDRGLRWSDCPWNRGWRSDHHPRWSNRPTLHGPFVACFANFGRASRCAHDFGGGPRDTPDSNSNSGCASCGSSVPALLMSPSGCAGAIGTAPTLAVAAGEGRTGGTSDQPSSNDHAGEAGLLALGR